MECVDYVFKKNPKVLGISMLLSYNIDEVRMFALVIRKQKPNINVVIRGKLLLSIIIRSYFKNY
jgi:hypothetical protein